jgi:hypothetical protein
VRTPNGSVAEAQGAGNWRGCYSVGDFHSVKIRFTNAPPAFLAPHFDEILMHVRKAYADVGLLIHWVDSGFANITSTFRNLGGSTIGLAQVVNNATCNSTQFADYNPGYKPSQTLIIPRWVSLNLHEICHGCGIGHQRSGHMAPTIGGGVGLTWDGDPARPFLASRFGGKRVPIPGDDTGDRELVWAWEYEDGRLEKYSGMWPNP